MWDIVPSLNSLSPNTYLILVPFCHKIKITKQNLSLICISILMQVKNPSLHLKANKSTHPSSTLALKFGRERSVRGASGCDNGLYIIF